MHLGDPSAKETAWAGRSSLDGRFWKFCVHRAPREFDFKLRFLGPSPGALTQEAQECVCHGNPR